MLADLITKLLTVFKGYAVDDEMVVYVLGIEVGRHQYLKAIASHSSCRFHADVVGFLRCNLALRKTLIAVVGGVLTALAIVLFDGHHIPIGGIPRTVDSGNKHLPIGLVGVGSVFERGIQIGSLFGIFNIQYIL